MSPQKNIASSLVLILFSLVFLIYTTRYPLDDWESPGPAVFPLALGVVLLLLAVWQLVQAFRDLKKQAPGKRQETKTAAFKRYLQENRGEAKVIRLTAMLLGYILFMKWIGFFVTTFGLVVLSSRLTETKDRVRPFALAAGVCLVCYLLFELWLKLSFPRGLLF